MSKHLNKLAESLRANIEANCTGWDDDPILVAERRGKVNDPVHGYEYFINNYFPHYVRNPDKSELHKYLFKILPEIAANHESCFEAIAAPRGEAKSTLVSQLYTLWRIVIFKTHFSLIVMDSIDQAYPMLEAIKAELEFNPRLKIDFPDVFGAGRVWQAGTIVTKNDIKVQVAGAGKKLRGLRHGAYRPDLVVLDDIENDENVRKPEQRDKLHNWLKKTIMPLGAAGEKIDIVYIGTILHHDSVLNRTLNNPAWRSARFKAIICMPSNMTLWDEWEALFHAKRLDDAEQFYLDHKTAMDAGAVVSWLARPILALMKIRARDGHDAFDSEYQNDPTAGEDAPFSQAIQYWHELPSNVVYFGACDPSLGKHGASRDPSAIVIGALDPKTGKLYIVKADIKKRLPDRIISDIISYQRQFNCQVWAIESVQFQEFFRTELVKRSAELGVPIPARPVVPHSDKLLRIESLQPHMANGLLLLHSDQSTLIDQFRHFPKADHDDGCDAVEMVWQLATKANRSSQSQALHIPEPRVYS
ncbi:phage terminase large subunit [Acinetobacter sp. c3-l95]|uniref:phage terminase large subunit n=1 Tax=Acinetobacter sp. c3-l95 TaxID=3342804 RepID=UPI0035B7F910